MSPTKSTKTEASAPALSTKDYTLLRGSHTREENGQMVAYSSRDPERNTISATDEEAKALGDRLRPVEGQQQSTEAQIEAALPFPELRQGGTGQPTEAVTAEANTGAGTSDWTRLSEMSWQDASAEIDGITSAAELDRAQAAEESGKNRKSVLEAIDARREELSK